MKYKAIIFDLDGVICHTDQYHYEAWKKITQQLGIEFDEKMNNRLRGISRMESLDVILENYDFVLSETEKMVYANEKNEIYKALMMNLTEDDLSEEVRDTLDHLRHLGYKLAIGSSSKNSRLILERLGLKDYFDAISDGNNITDSKPSPEVFIKAALYLQTPQEDCLVVEDAVAGLEAAKAAQMDCAAIGDAVNSKLANYNLVHFKDLINICD
ncbi:MAG: beta-phosphoglucomutase [Firmicutes bacterium HGW-Firmicutes-5]|nr:MAG: beta-phosphoglucomutase [Firmicutes bacterium HGW-Firmicutes-5]